MTITVTFCVKCCQCDARSAFDQHIIFVERIDAAQTDAIRFFEREGWTHLPSGRWVCSASDHHLDRKEGGGMSDVQLVNEMRENSRRSKLWDRLTSDEKRQFHSLAGRRRLAHRRTACRVCRKLRGRRTVMNATTIYFLSLLGIIAASVGLGIAVGWKLGYRRAIDDVFDGRVTECTDAILDAKEIV